MWMCHAMLFGSVGYALGSPNIIIKKVYMRKNMTDGAKQNMTKRRNGVEQLER